MRFGENINNTKEKETGDGGGNEFREKESLDNIRRASRDIQKIWNSIPEEQSKNNFSKFKGYAQLVFFVLNMESGAGYEDDFESVKKIMDNCEDNVEKCSQIYLKHELSLLVLDEYVKVLKEKLGALDEQESAVDGVDWESLDKQKIREQLFEYLSDAEKGKLRLAKNEKRGDSGYSKQYVDGKGRIIRLEKHYNYSSEEDYESSDSFFEKEYSYGKNGNVESFAYRTKGYFDYDSIISSNEWIGRATLEHEKGRVKKVNVKEVRSDYSEWSTDNNYEGGRDIEFFVEYDENSNVVSILKETKEFRSSQAEKEVIYEKNRDKEKVFRDMSALEIIEWNLTRFNQ